ncbi:HAMP domain-containing sensor histidine kinase [Jutongia sp.]|uniref:sensor histidine kinase n=1 Tax=Jutongia sp. TaxID=2944204 RepID=UPI00307A39CF
MKHNIWKSLRMKLVLYGTASLLLAAATEGILALLLYLMSTVLGVSRQNSLYDYSNVTSDHTEAYFTEGNSGMKTSFLRTLGNIGDDTLYTIAVVGMAAGLLLFIFYFLLLTRKVTGDLSDIADGISSMTRDREAGSLPVDRQDEIGEIARSVHQMTEELSRLMASEREALQSNKEKIACLAHDLRTPLTSLSGYLNLAMDTDKYDVEQRQHFAEVAARKADRLEGLIQDLFDYTKLMSGEITLHRRRIDFVKLVEQMIEEFYPLLEENELTCSFQTECRELEMDVDPDLMARAVQNLLSNAVKYGKDGKQIIIRLEKGRNVTFSVTNYGLIIPEKSLDMIFERFYRVEGARSPGTGGTGLGLNIAKEIITLHGGTITVESGLQGTVFSVEIPRKEATEDA